MNSDKSRTTDAIRPREFELTAWEDWCARRDSNAGPLAPEANALSGLSYGRKERNLLG